MDVKLAKNESEGVQLMITPEEDVAYYNVSVSDLSDNAGHTISDVEVYAEFYVKLTKHTNPNSVRPLGYYPDALIPMEVSKKSGENKIGAGQNQAVYINVTTSDRSLCCWRLC